MPRDGRLWAWRLAQASRLTLSPCAILQCTRHAPCEDPGSVFIEQAARVQRPKEPKMQLTERVWNTWSFIGLPAGSMQEPPTRLASSSEQASAWIPWRVLELAGIAQALRIFP